MKLNIPIMRAAGTDLDFPIPSYQSSGAVGLDMRAYLTKDMRVNGLKLLPRERALISSGFMMGIPEGFEGQIRARSGLARRFGIVLANGVGTVDSDYRGTIGILLINLGSEPHVIRHSSRIAQIIVAPVMKVEFSLVTSLLETSRNQDGFGSTGEN